MGLCPKTKKLKQGGNFNMKNGMKNMDSMNVNVTSLAAVHTHTHTHG